MFSINNLTVKNKLFLLVGFSIFGLVAFGAFSYSIVSTVKIGSAAYEHIVVEKELHTMLHPPRMVLFRSGLFTGLMLSETEPAKLQELVDKTKEMSRVYRETRDLWMPKIESEDVKRILEEKAYPLGLEYTRIRDDEFIPLIQQGEREKARQLMVEKLTPLLFRHIDATTEALKAQEAEIRIEEEKTASIVAQRTAFLIIIALLTIVAVIALSWYIARNIVNPLSQVVSKLKAISTGDTYQTLDYQAKDEIGALADAFRDLTVYIKNVVSTVESLGKGDLSAKIEARSEKDVLAKSLSQTIESLNDLVRQTNGLIRAAREGQLSNRADSAKFEGAYKELTDGINQMMDAIVTPVRETSVALERIADHDLTVRVTGSYKGEFEKIKNSLNAAAGNLDGGFQQVAVSAEQVASAAGQISAGSQSLAQGASEQASTLEEVSSSLQEIASMSKQNAANSNEARSLSENANLGTQKGVANMQRLTAAIERIKTSSDSTSKIVKTIEEIAFQTNLLALNAAVEAARAGDAGRGFAVVAEEVRNLAMRSAEAARSTAQLIDEAVSNTGEGVTLNAEVSQNLSEINTQIQKVNYIVAEIAAASEQQNQGVEQINSAIEQMNSVTQQTAANSEESASAAEELSSQSQEMLSMIEHYKLSRNESGGVAPAPARTDGERRAFAF